MIEENVTEALQILCLDMLCFLVSFKETSTPADVKSVVMLSENCKQNRWYHRTLNGAPTQAPED
jgi:hypothetical protein